MTYLHEAMRAVSALRVNTVPDDTHQSYAACLSVAQRRITVNLSAYQGWGYPQCPPRAQYIPTMYTCVVLGTHSGPPDSRSLLFKPQCFPNVSCPQLKVVLWQPIQFQSLHELSNMECTSLDKANRYCILS